MMINTDSERPIGYWLKKLDRLIDTQFELQLSTADCRGGSGSCSTCSRIIRDPYQNWRLNSNPSYNASHKN